MRIAVYGATGRIGRQVMREALRRRHEVTAVVRDPTRLADRRPGLWAVTGDVLDPLTVARTALGHNVVISALGPGSAASHSPSVYRVAAESMVRALRALGAAAPRMITVGCAAVPDLADTPGQREAYDFLRGVSDVSWSYVSPATRIEPGERTCGYRTDLAAEESARISLEDYAVALIDEAERARHVGQAVTVAY